ncbi:hypothetical protein MKK75_15535 [Methylobacterium sp. J-030]|nr:hypothetical protein [Methylobacterium sp. J-030]MCJ2070193.1 hypothetical protein [Methylobacterium sp. J-030]
MGYLVLVRRGPRPFRSGAEVALRRGDAKVQRNNAGGAVRGRTWRNRR